MWQVRRFGETRPWLGIHDNHAIFLLAERYGNEERAIAKRLRRNPFSTTDILGGEIRFHPEEDE